VLTFSSCSFVLASINWRFSFWELWFSYSVYCLYEKNIRLWEYCFLSASLVFCRISYLWSYDGSFFLLLQFPHELHTHFLINSKVIQVKIWVYKLRCKVDLETGGYDTRQHWKHREYRIYCLLLYQVYIFLTQKSTVLYSIFKYLM